MTRFAFLISEGRCGTHLLRSILAQEDWIADLGETFNQDLARIVEHDFTRFLDRYITANPQWKMVADEADRVFTTYLGYLKNQYKTNWILIDIKFSQLRILDWPPTKLYALPRVLRHILHGDHAIVRLSRTDLLAQCASLALAQQTGEWHRLVETASTRSPRLRLAPQQVLSQLNGYRASEQLTDAWLNGREVAHLKYETMMDGNRLAQEARAGLERVFQLPLSRTASAGTTKIAPPLRELVENLDEVLAVLDGTEFQNLKDVYAA
jgi:hypothetical protein